MRIKRLELDAFKNLRSFSINFDETSPTTVIVGQNGAGKSNLLEALIIIFRDLDLGKQPQFAYTLEYRCHDHDIAIAADPTKAKKGEQVKIQIDGEDVSYARFGREARGIYLPRYLFGYYSGPSNRMEEHFDEHQKIFCAHLLSGEDEPLRPLLYARQVHSQFALLAFFTERDDTVSSFLRDYLRIESLDSVLFVMSRPGWYNSSIKRRNLGGDARFWYARGTVKRLLDKLYALALAPIHIDRGKNQDNLYLYIPALDSLEALSANYGSRQEFFKALESTYISDLIRDVRIRVRVRNADQALTFRELSEGEQQLLMVLGLLRFTKEEESLFLLDEPDTHLNAVWSMHYLEFLGRVVGEQPTSQIIMTTHDPLVIADLERSEVRILEIDETTDRIRVLPPDVAPARMGYAELLTSDIFKLRSGVNTRIQALLDSKRLLAAKEERTPEEEERLRLLNAELAEFDFTSVVRDPLYEPFVRAMAQAEREQELNLPVLTREERERRMELARDIVKRLIREAKQTP